MKRDPELRTKCNGIAAVPQEWIDDKRASGDTEKDAALVQARIKLIIKEAGFTEYAEVDLVKVRKAISDLKDKRKLRTATANKYLQAACAWTQWVYDNERWDRDPLDKAKKFKGDFVLPQLDIERI